MYLPAVVAVGPVLISGNYLVEIHPLYGKEIEILGMVAVDIGGFLQWYWIGRLLEVPLGYRSTFADHKFTKRGRIGNNVGLMIAALLGFLGAFVAFQPGGMTIGIIGALWASACVIGLVRIRLARKDSSPKTTELSLR
jgi:hypothetical protein